ncbi:MAG: hypothetical protein R6W78_03495 [Bacteroidales bacterium]
MAPYWQYIEKHKNSFAFWILFALMFIHLVTSGNTSFYHDTSYYWSLGETFENEKGFALVNYHDALRGVCFPFILWLLNKTAIFLNLAPLLVVRLFSALYFSAFSAILIPKLAGRISPEIKVNFWKIMSFGILIFIFWKNYFNYPLSDFPSVFIFLWGIYFLFSEKPALLVPAGILIGSAINFRQIYLIALLPIGIYLILNNHAATKHNTQVKRGFSIFLLLMGLLIIHLPQTLVNRQHFGTLSPMVQTEKYGFRKNLFFQQLLWGVQYEKYETNVGYDYPKAQVFFIDRMGSSIAEYEKINHFKNYGDLGRLFLKYPVELTCIYFKHLFNGLDIKDDTVYLKKVSRRKYLFSFLNYSVMFLALLTLYLNRKDIFIDRKGLFFLLIILSIIVLSVPTAIETRFMLPLFLYLYMVVVFFINHNNRLLSVFNNHLLPLSITYISFIVTCFVLSNSTYANIEVIQHPSGRSIPARSTNEEIYFDMERSTFDTTYSIATYNQLRLKLTDSLVSIGKISDVSRSGRYSVATHEKSQYPFGYWINNVAKGDRFFISVWRKGSRANYLAVFGTMKDSHFNRISDIPDSLDNGWERLQLEIKVKNTPIDNRLGVFVQTTDTGTAFFDDFRVKYLAE